ncbi:hypothetical protein PRIPAC_80482 [Pristionchus pacificus]|uniref:G protein-coupled receptor n=1 Tax=Pristionchus pacificus TaxID=54126 RepID=A0A2A6CNZ1_PRIPA|nr:hypothetical protein PRIPAC_80482 [Pristionchus pacificus]|eukprot:PDM79797.1 G protein-coupled receptor [Pristionchus pacificus]
MNSTELSVEFHDAVEVFNHAGGMLSFAFNSVMCLLILLDKDPRGKDYRKYMLSLQFFSTAADIFLSSYSLFVLINLPVAYSESALTHVFDALTACIIYVSGLTEIAVSYFFCVYYRRREIPNCMSWVKTKQAYLVFNTGRVDYPSLIIAIGGALIFGFIIIIMIGQIVIELRQGMLNSSPATKRYQSRAVFSLAMQGVVPSIFYVDPAFSLLGIYLYGQTSHNAVYDRTASTISVLSVNVLTSHAIVHSMTILACSPSYRKSIRSAITRVIHRVFYCKKLSVEFENAVELFNYIGGSLSFLFNSFVCLLILRDKEPRGKAYRKYLFSLQFFSTAADFFLSSYSMFALMNLPGAYSNSALSRVLDIVTAGGAVPGMCYTIPAFIMFGLSLNASEGALYNKRNSTISVLSVNVLTSHALVHSLTILACSPSYSKAVRSMFARVLHRVFHCKSTSTVQGMNIPPPQRSTPATSKLSVEFQITVELLNHISGKRSIEIVKSFIFRIKFNRLSSDIILAEKLIGSTYLSKMVLSRGLKGWHYALNSSKGCTIQLQPPKGQCQYYGCLLFPLRYQSRAVYSLAMQGAVPSMFYVVPAFVIFGLYLYVSALSVLSVNVLASHAIVYYHYDNSRMLSILSQDYSLDNHESLTSCILLENHSTTADICAQLAAQLPLTFLHNLYCRWTMSTHFIGTSLGFCVDSSIPGPPLRRSLRSTCNILIAVCAVGDILDQVGLFIQLPLLESIATKS